MADYCTATQLKAAGRLNISTTTYDTELAALVTAASRWIDQHCCNGLADAFAAAAGGVRRFTREAVYGDSLILDMPILAISAVVNGDAASLTVNTLRLQPRNGRWFRQIQMLSTGVGWSFAADGEIVVTGTWGLYASGSTPAPILEACAMIAGWWFKRYQMALADATANADLGAVIYGEAVPKQVLAILAPYREGRLV